MTEQYARTNINSPRLPRGISADVQLTLDDEFIIIDGGAPTLTLPTALQIPSRAITIKSLTGTGIVDTVLGQTIDGAPTFTFTAVDEPLTVKSDGQNWLIVNEGSGGGGGGVVVEDEGVPVVTPATILNFIGAGVTAAPGAPGVADITIPGGGFLTGPGVPEGTVAGTPGDLYQRVSGSVSTFWQYLGGAPGVIGWRALGPFIRGTPVGAINGVNTTYTFPGGVEGVNQPSTPTGSQIEFRVNGIDQTEGVDYAVTPGSVPGTTILSVVLVVPPLVGDVLTVTFIPA